MKTQVTYQVGLKILIKKGDDFLFLKTPTYKLLDLPGGRIDEDEHNATFSEIIAREVKEELGENLKYKLGKPVFQFRRRSNVSGLHVFITVYEAEYLSGEIKLSDEHSSYWWMDPRKVGFEQKIFFSKEERFAFEEYFKNLA